MKNIFKISILLVAVLLNSCQKDDPIDFLKDIKPGYSADFSKSEAEITCTRENNPIVVYYDVDISLKIAVNGYTDIQKHLIYKSLINSDNEIVSTALAHESELLDTIEFSLSSGEDLMENLDFVGDSIKTGYYFSFESKVVTGTNDTLKTATAYQLVPTYLNFCTLAEIPVGTYEASNLITGFKKDVEIQKGVWIYGWVWSETLQDFELGWTFHEDYYMITDFGLDWCNWNDWWYGTVFTLDCPKPGDTRYVINLPGDGMDTTDEYTMIDRETGEDATKTLRLMPYKYQTTTEDIGYYDASSDKLIFKNVSVTDAWWDADKHIIEDVVFTFKAGK